MEKDYFVEAIEDLPEPQILQLVDILLDERNRVQNNAKKIREWQATLSEETSGWLYQAYPSTESLLEPSQESLLGYSVKLPADSSAKAPYSLKIDSCRNQVKLKKRPRLNLLTSNSSDIHLHPGLSASNV